MAINLPDDWMEVLSDEFEKPYYLKLKKFLKNEYTTKTIYPKSKDIYNAFRYTPYKKVKVVILGQDPYINAGEAHGLAFSVNKGIKIPPSLKNVYKAVQKNTGCYIPRHGCLTEWAKQGVLLLNTVLTVRAESSHSHKDKGWETFTDRVIEILNEREEPIVFMLWGQAAKKKKKLITNEKHVIFEYVHPSPLASNFFDNCSHFSRANDFLIKNNMKPIDWQIHD